MSKLFVDEIVHASSQGSGTITLGASGETLDLSNPSTVTLNAAMKNTPAFFAYLSSNQTLSNDTVTKLTLNTELFDTHNAFDSSTNYRFTVPSGHAGYYSISGQMRSNAGADFDHLNFYIKKNNTDFVFSKCRNEVGETLNASAVVSLSVGDYLEIFGYHQRGSNSDISGGSTMTFFTGHKLIGT
jgi:hypothetical protein